MLADGTGAYRAGGGPAVRGRNRWTIERQVRLAAGVLVAVSIAVSLSYPKARFVAGVIGSGLALAAVTDTCVMGRALSTLPYNRTPSPRSSRESLAQLRPDLPER